LQTLTNTEHLKMEADRAFEEWKRLEFDTEIKAEKYKSEEEKSVDSEEAVLPEERKTQSFPDNSVVALSSQCSVCSAPAADHLHYGAISCYSCRAFFRRGVPKQQRCIFGSDDCQITMKNRTNCKVCRYRACLARGMVPEKVNKYLNRRKEREAMLARCADVEKETKGDEKKQKRKQRKNGVTEGNKSALAKTEEVETPANLSLVDSECEVDSQDLWLPPHINSLDCDRMFNSQCQMPDLKQASQPKYFYENPLKHYLPEFGPSTKLLQLL